MNRHSLGYLIAFLAILTCQCVEALRPGDAGAYNNIGAAYCELGRWADAIPPLQLALKLNPEDTLARANLRWAETELGKTPR